MSIDTTKISQLDFLSPGLKSWVIQKSPHIILVVLIVLLSVQLADTGWRIVNAFISTPEINKSNKVVMRNNLANQKKRFDYQSFSNMHLFGIQDANVVIEDAPLTAPETRLNLILYGVFAGDNLKQGTAIIGSKQGKQKHFKVEDKVDTGVWLAEVRKDHVLLKRGSNFEILRFPKQSSSGVTIKQKKTRRLPVKLNGGKQAFMDNIRIVPVFADKGLKGYRILPKKNRAIYNRLGIKPSDIITSINGISLSNEREAMKVIGELVKSDQVDVKLERRGEIKSLTLNLK